MTMRIATVIAVFLSAFLCQAQECNNEGICDEHARCPVWKEEGECFKNKAYMLKTCPVSCEQDEIKTKGDVCEDLHKRCFVWAELGECKDVPEMQEVCPKSCGLCNQEDTTEDCSDNHKNCEFWAKNGECDANPNYMVSVFYSNQSKKREKYPNHLYIDMHLFSSTTVRRVAIPAARYAKQCRKKRRSL